MESCFSEDFLKVLESGRDEAMRTGWRNISPDHIMLSMLRHRDNSACRALELLGVDEGSFKKSIEEAIFVPAQIPWDERGSILPGENSQTLLSHAALEAGRCGERRISCLHFLLATLRIPGSFSHDYLMRKDISLRSTIEAAGLSWEHYGLRPGGSSGVTVPDGELMAAAIEKRLREGYSAGDVQAS